MTEQWEPCESGDSRTVLRAAEGEVPSAYSPNAADLLCSRPLTKTEEKDRIISTAQAGPLIPKRNLSKQAEPPLKRLVVHVGETQVERNGALGAVTGFPSIVVPGGFSSSTQAATLGVPVGIEFLGRPWSEKLLIEIGYGYEQATKYRRPPSTTPPITASAR